MIKVHRLKLSRIYDASKHKTNKETCVVGRDDSMNSSNAFTTQETRS